MEAGYKIEGDRVLHVSVSMTFDEIIKDLSDDSRNGRYGFLGKIQSLVAERIADEFILRHLDDVLAAMDPKHIANLATLNALATMKGK